MLKEDRSKDENPLPAYVISSVLSALALTPRPRDLVTHDNKILSIAQI